MKVKHRECREAENQLRLIEERLGMTPTQYNMPPSPATMLLTEINTPPKEHRYLVGPPLGRLRQLQPHRPSHRRLSLTARTPLRQILLHEQDEVLRSLPKKSGQVNVPGDELFNLERLEFHLRLFC